MTKSLRATAALAVLGLLASEPLTAAEPDWVAASNANTQVLLGVMAKYSPEDATELGVQGVEQEILDLSRDPYEPLRVATQAAIAELGRRLASEPHPKVRQDLEILIRSAEDSLASNALQRRYFFPYSNPASSHGW